MAALPQSVVWVLPPFARVSLIFPSFLCDISTNGSRATIVGNFLSSAIAAWDLSSLAAVLQTVAQ